VQGQGGHAALLWAARCLVRGFLLPDEVAHRLLVEHYNPRCVPPWEGRELERDFRHKLDEARNRPFDKPDGWLLHCGDTAGVDLSRLVGGGTARANGAAHGPRVEAPAHGDPAMVRLADVPPEEVGWLWPARIPAGKLTIVAGDPGLGKSYMVLDIIARVSVGAPWPDDPDAHAPLGGAVILTCEDGLGDTIRPRLNALGADCRRIHAMKGVRRADGKIAHFTLEDVTPLRLAIEGVPDCRVVMIDAVSGYMGAADSHNNAETRAVLAGLAELAEETGVSIIGVSHLAKSGAHVKRSAYRVMGSLAFVAAPRAVWAVGADEDDRDRRVLANVKMNIARPAPSWAYRIDDAGLHWEDGPCDLDCETLLGGDRGEPGRPPVEREEAEAFLLQLLTESPEGLPAKQIKAEAQDAGFSWITIRRAKDQLGVVVARRGFGSKGVWQWTLPGALIGSNGGGEA